MVGEKFADMIATLRMKMRRKSNLWQECTYINNAVNKFIDLSYYYSETD